MLMGIQNEKVELGFLFVPIRSALDLRVRLLVYEGIDVEGISSASEHDTWSSASVFINLEGESNSTFLIRFLLRLLRSPTSDNSVVGLNLLLTFYRSVSG